MPSCLPSESPVLRPTPADTASCSPQGPECWQHPLGVMAGQQPGAWGPGGRGIFLTGLFPLGSLKGGLWDSFKRVHTPNIGYIHPNIGYIQEPGPSMCGHTGGWKGINAPPTPLAAQTPGAEGRRHSPLNAES